MTGELTHIELGAPDAKKAKAFFGPLFGWTFQQFGDGEQAVIQAPGIRGGRHDGVTTATFTAYFRVEDISAAVARMRELGGHAEDRQARTRFRGSGRVIAALAAAAPSGHGRPCPRSLTVDSSHPHPKRGGGDWPVATARSG